MKHEPSKYVPHIYAIHTIVAYQLVINLVLFMRTLLVEPSCYLRASRYGRNVDFSSARIHKMCINIRGNIFFPQKRRPRRSAMKILLLSVCIVRRAPIIPTHLYRRFLNTIPPHCNHKKYEMHSIAHTHMTITTTSSERSVSSSGTANVPAQFMSL